MPHFMDFLFRRWKTLDESWRFAIVAFLILRIFYSIWAWTILILQPLAVQNLDWANEPILAIFNLQDSRAYTYLRTIDGRDLTFRAANPHEVTDWQTGSLWDISTGTALGGPSEGLKLDPGAVAPSVFFPYHNVKPHPIVWLAIWQRFDANWYLSIAQNGYGAIHEDIHFPPLFPLLIRILQPLLYGDAFLAGLFISHLNVIFAVKLLYDNFCESAGQLPARRTICIMLLYPTSFFLFSAYTESLFLVTILLSLQQMKRRSWHWSGFWAFCAFLTRLQGAALILPLIYLMWNEGLFLRKPAHWFGLALPGFGGVFYLALRSMLAKNHVLPLVEPDLHARLGSPWESYWYAIQTLLAGQFAFVDFLNWGVATLFLILLIAGWRTIPLEDNLYTALSFLFMLVRIVETQPLNSISRYSLTLFPSFLVIGLAAGHPWIRRAIIYTFIPLNLYLSAQFFLWGWVA